MNAFALNAIEFTKYRLKLNCFVLNRKKNEQIAVKSQSFDLFWDRKKSTKPAKKKIFLENRCSKDSFYFLPHFFFGFCFFLFLFFFCINPVRWETKASIANDISKWQNSKTFKIKMHFICKCVCLFFRLLFTSFRYSIRLRIGFILNKWTGVNASVSKPQTVNKKQEEDNKKIKLAIDFCKFPVRSIISLLCIFVFFFGFHPQSFLSARLRISN